MVERPRERPLVTIGGFTCTAHSVSTPRGTYPIAGTAWTVSENTHVERYRPVWAIVLTIVFVLFCLVGLLFLLVKRERAVGYLEVGVTGPGFYETTQISIRGPRMIADVQNRVAYARRLADYAARERDPRTPPPRR